MPGREGPAEATTDYEASPDADVPKERRGLLLRVVTDQRVAFAMVGGVNTLLGIAWFALFQTLLGSRLGPYGYMVSLVCGYSTSILCAFFLHRYLVFRVRGHFWLDLGRFTLVNCAGLGANAVLLPAVVETTHWHPIIAQAVVAIGVAVISYAGHKYFSFRRADKSSAGGMR